MEYSIFFSWQSDSDKAHNLTFIRQALNEAVAQIRSQDGVNDFPIVESGMERTSGSPEVATVMFNKIRSSAIFLADVTTVGTIEMTGGRGKKPVPNPNVMVEMGYAAGTIGWGRIICVMNEKYGRVEKLPVDVRNRRFPIRYKLGGEQMHKSEEIKTVLMADIKHAIEAVVYTDYQATRDAERRLDVNCIQVVAYFRNVPFFNSPPPGYFDKDAFGDINPAIINAAIPRLLDLNLVHCDFNSEANKYAYHWTYLGKMYIKSKWSDATPD